MAASSRTGQANTSKKVRILGICILLVIGIYTGGWYFVADQARSRLMAALDRSQGAAISAECPDAEIRGFPFRFGLFCSGVSIDDNRRGISASFGALRSAAQVYDPFHVVFEVDEPVVVRAAPGLTFSAEWTALQSSAQLATDGVERTSLAVDGLKANLVSALAGELLNLNASHGELHLRRNGPDLDAAASLLAVSGTVEGKDRPLPPVTVDVDVTMAEKAALLQGAGKDAANLRGAKGELRALSADLGEGRTLRISGPFSFNDEGYVSGKLKLEIAGIEGWRQTLKTAFPEAAKNIDTAGNMLTALVSGGNQVSVDLTLRDGDIMISGFIKVGEIPPI
ncbi:hypothetical protein DEM27_16400 [Metarhizobium album]|uniref:DUF2125 domain-containing protein n=1 Tax=Metarhizobium album TaxID=2182425 RepID=A0A2U2DP31_9HYPH|nr:DUF2125 domain-containing protein [Rhizobium album]PWE55032.1 hypothetical protein DEM27_16400 [Rhizobium album]